MSNLGVASVDLPAFDRHFWDGKFQFTRIGSGAIGGKASGLVFVKTCWPATWILATYPTSRSASPHWL